MLDSFKQSHYGCLLVVPPDKSGVPTGWYVGELLNFLHARETSEISLKTELNLLSFVSTVSFCFHRKRLVGYKFVGCTYAMPPMRIVLPITTMNLLGKEGTATYHATIKICLEADGKYS
jgi:hypothetical protein